METAIRIRNLTAGLPLFVRSAIAVTKADYDSNLEAFCSAFENQVLASDTRQHTLLSAVFGSLDTTSKQVLACASLADIPLAASEIAGVVNAAFALEAHTVIRKLRALRSRGLVQAYGSQTSKVHDAMRAIALEYLAEESQQGRRARIFLAARVKQILIEESNKELFPLFIRLLIDLRDVATLADLGTEEAFHEGPQFPQMWPVLREASADLSLSADVRFDCLDALLYQRQRHGPEEEVPALLEEMNALVESCKGKLRSRLVYLQKSTVYWADQGERNKVRELLDKANALLPDKTAYRRIFSYTEALVLWKMAQYAEAEDLLRNLIPEYLQLLAIDCEVLLNNPGAYVTRIHSDDEFGANCKRLADCFDLLIHVTDDLRKSEATTRMIAMRLFEITGSWDSLVRVGIDLFYQYLETGKLPQALLLVSSQLPHAAERYGLDRHKIPLRVLCAHVLGLMGRIPEAQALIRAIDPFIGGLTPDWQAETKRLTAFLR